MRDAGKRSSLADNLTAPWVTALAELLPLAKYSTLDSYRRMPNQPNPEVSQHGRRNENARGLPGRFRL